MNFVIQLLTHFSINNATYHLKYLGLNEELYTGKYLLHVLHLNISHFGFKSFLFFFDLVTKSFWMQTETLLIGKSTNKSHGRKITLLLLPIRLLVLHFFTILFDHNTFDLGTFMKKLFR